MSTRQQTMLKEAKQCHTKLAWTLFFERYRNEIISTSDSKPLREIFKLLKGDPQALRYDTIVWQYLLQGCLSSWNLELGKEISRFTEKIPSPEITILAADIFLESGAPKISRSIANRALRLISIKSSDKLQLQMIICSSYVEEGNQAMAIRLLSRMEQAIDSADSSLDKHSDLLMNMARAQFFLGRYLKAAETFEHAYHIFKKENNWEFMTRCLFNTAASFHNSGQHYRNKAYELVDECKHLAEHKGLEGALSHCYAFYGTDQYQRGNFERAKREFKSALDHLPESDQSFRRLHITSMLALTYLRLGQIQIANKYGNITLDLAAKDKSERFKSRYDSLQAELLWLEGKVEESQKLLQDASAHLYANGVNTLEELSAISRYFLQCAQLKIDVSTQIKIAEQLKNNSVSWLEFLFAKSQLYLSRRRLSDAQKYADECYERAKEYNAKYFVALGLLTSIQCKLLQNELDHQFEGQFQKFKNLMASMPKISLSVHIQIIEASISYKKGDFKEAAKHLRLLKKAKSHNMPRSSIINSWVATIEGHSPKMYYPWQFQLVARATQIYFTPSLEQIDKESFLVSQIYEIQLHRHPILAKLLIYLLSLDNCSASTADLQKQVWNQSLSSHGWQQKIRNTVMRIRDLFPYTMAPIIIHSDNHVRLFSEAIRLKQVNSRSSVPLDEEILLLLKHGPLSTIELSNQILKSRATVKRVLKKLQSSQKILAAKSGRNVLYKINDPAPINLDQEINGHA